MTQLDHKLCQMGLAEQIPKASKRPISCLKALPSKSWQSLADVGYTSICLPNETWQRVAIFWQTPKRVAFQARNSLVLCQKKAGRGGPNFGRGKQLLYWPASFAPPYVVGGWGAKPENFGRPS